MYEYGRQTICLSVQIKPKKETKMNNIVKECKQNAFNAGTKAKGESSYSGVIADVAIIFSKQITQIVGKMRTEVAQYGAGISMTMAMGFENIDKKVKSQLENVIGDAFIFPKKQSEYQIAFTELKKRYPNLDQSIVEKTVNKTDDDTVVLFAIFIVALLIESVVGSFLLGEVFAGGFIAALGFAFAVSAINVGGLGIGLGVLFDKTHRRHHINVQWFILWFMGVVALNGGIAYFRYDQVSKFEEVGELDPVLAMLLFAFLGVMFSCIAFWKTYQRWEPEYLLHTKFSLLTKKKESFYSNVNNIINKHTENALSINSKIELFFQNLQEIVFSVNDEWNELEIQYNLIIPIIAEEFVDGYNTAHLSNIKVKDLSKEYSFSSWEELIKEYTARQTAQKILDEWKNGKMESFVKSYAILVDNIAHDKKH
ncbi:MAG: hypothetical protein ACNYPH_00730 [Gammaproteobacteria bacterium WSBS_2016_MAG_OTU1]